MMHSAPTVPFRPEAVPADRVVRAALAASRLAPGDRALLHGPYAGPWETVLEHLGVCVKRVDTPAAARQDLLRPGGTAFETAMYFGPAGDADRAKAVEAADLVRPGRNSLAVVHGEDLAAVPPADALRLPDRRGFGLGTLGHPASPGGWVLHTVPGAACWRGAQGTLGPASKSNAA